MNFFFQKNFRNVQIPPQYLMSDRHHLIKLYKQSSANTLLKYESFGGIVFRIGCFDTKLSISESIKIDSSAMDFKKTGMHLTLMEAGPV